MNVENFANPEVNIRELGVYEGQVAVDFGAGTGTYTMLLAERVGEGGRVIAVEVQKEFLTNIKNPRISNSIFTICRECVGFHNIYFPYFIFYSANHTFYNPGRSYMTW